MKTQFTKKSEADRKWYLMDASNMVLGRLAAKVADYLRGKNKPVFTPNADTGDFVIIVNAEKIKLTGAKLDNKIYYHHSGYPGGIKAVTARERLKSCPEDIIKDAVEGMLPKNRLARTLIKKLKVYRGSEHPHSAQKPQVIQITQ